MATAGTVRGRYRAGADARGLSITTALVNAVRLDLRSLAALRVGLAAVVIVQLLYDSVYLRGFWTDEGLIPRAGLLQIWRNPWVWSIHVANGTWQIVALLVAVQVAVALCLVLGFRTRTATVLLWVLVASLQTRNPIILDASDGLLRLMLFWGIFLPWGGRFSIDAARRRAAWPPPARSHHTSWHCSTAGLRSFVQTPSTTTNPVHLRHKFVPVFGPALDSGRRLNLWRESTGLVLARRSLFSAQAEHLAGIDGPVWRNPV